MPTKQTYNLNELIGISRQVLFIMIFYTLIDHIYYNYEEVGVINDNLLEIYLIVC